MRVPEGWKLVPINATRKMIDAAETVEENGYDAMHRAMLAAAPTPPAQEDEPVAHRYRWRTGPDAKWSEWKDRVINSPERPDWIHPDHEVEVEAIYTRPQSDKLREAAKEVVSAIIALEGTEIEYRLALNLATANKKLVEALKDQK